MCHWFCNTAAKARKIVEKMEKLAEMEFIGHTNTGDEHVAHHHVVYEAAAHDHGDHDHAAYEAEAEMDQGSQIMHVQEDRQQRKQRKRQEKQRAKAEKKAAKEARRRAKYATPTPEPEPCNHEDLWGRLTDEERMNFVRAETEFKVTMQMCRKKPVLVDENGAPMPMFEHHPEHQHHVDEHLVVEHHPDQQHHVVEHHPDQHHEDEAQSEEFRDAVYYVNDGQPEEQHHAQDCMPALTEQALAEEERRSKERRSKKGKGKGKAKTSIRWVYEDEVGQSSTQDPNPYLPTDVGPQDPWYKKVKQVVDSDPGWQKFEQEQRVARGTKKNEMERRRMDEMFEVALAGIEEHKNREYEGLVRKLCDSP